MTPQKDDYDEKYTDPELRRRLKAEIEASSKGGKKGQWSARKSQLLVREYEKQGGDYKGEKSDDAKSLEAWTDENWVTQDGSADARGEDGSTKRYLPEKAWDLLSAEEKREAEEKKQKGDKEGKQYVENTLEAKEARKRAQAEGKKGGRTKAALLEEARKRDLGGRSKMSKGELERALAKS
ncbi:MAG: hypothetical protein AVDCRST_MAG86-1321 [uncultured Truepera sp.]|uniref:DUF5872 domain-containing protein n=1 Tax=uncultured Truepera sp. TaxID=543023 RepID=A0A6J4V7H2_9DEIN|nr:MAG: hypothetical protein AVDCRST_MAG86-1321 [uncultured Truepera sp.]